MWPFSPTDEDPELLALVARIRATLLNPTNVIQAKGNLAEVLQAFEEVDDPNYGLDAEVGGLDVADYLLDANHTLRSSPCCVYDIEQRRTATYDGVA